MLEFTSEVDMFVFWCGVPQLLISLWVVGLALVGFTAGCGRAAMEPVGVTTSGSSGATEIATTDSVASSTWPSYAKLRTSAFVRANGKKFRSAGHYFGRFDADILISAESEKSYRELARGRSLSNGSIVVKIHVLPTGEPGPLLAMERVDGAWVFIELSSAGRVIRRGALHPCVGCHAHMEDQDWLFGIPAGAR